MRRNGRFERLTLRRRGMTRLKRRFKTSLLVILLATFCEFGVTKTAHAQTAPTKTFLETLARAEARTNARQWVEAATSWEQVIEHNPVEGRFWFQLADARYQAREFRKAIPAYEKVIELGWGIPANAAYNIACGYALLGEKEASLNWLERAFQMGFRNLENARRDADLELLRDDPRFRRIVALPELSRMSRDEGWRYDLALLAREVKRVGYAPLLNQTGGTIDTAVKNLHDSVPKLTDIQIIIEMTKLMRKVGDGHTGLLPTHPEFQPTLPVQFYLFQEGLFIIAADPKYKELLGAQVLRFQEQTIDNIIRALDPLISRDNENPIWTRQRAPYLMRNLPLLNGLGLISSPAEVSLTIRALDGAERVVKLMTDTSQPNIWNVKPHPATWVGLPQTLAAPLPLYLKNAAAPYWFEHLAENKLVYFQFNSVRNDRNEPFAQFVARLLKFIDENAVEGLMIDLRWNNGGNTGLAPSLIQGLIRHDKINRRGKLFVIIGRRTFSAAQNTATYLEQQTNAIFVGEPTGSSPNFVGEEDFFTLPYSKLQANVSELFWQSSWPGDRRIWIAPLLYTPPTFAAYRANRDLALEAILDYRRAQ
jgi:hypothetical protein